MPLSMLQLMSVCMSLVPILPLISRLVFNCLVGITVVVKSLSCVRLFVTPWTARHQDFLSSLFPRVCSSSCPLSRWCSLTILPSSALFCFSLSQNQGLFQWVSSGGQNIGASASASVLPMNIQGWFPLKLTSLISLQARELWRVFSSTTIQKPSILWCSTFFMVQLSHSLLQV